MGQSSTERRRRLQSRIRELEAALQVIASNGEGRGPGWTPAQHARNTLGMNPPDVPRADYMGNVNHVGCEPDCP